MTEAYPNENLGAGHNSPTFQCRSTSGYKYKTHVRSFQQNCCHKNATRRGPETVKVVFDITRGISDFRAYIFSPPTTQELPKKNHEARTSDEQLPTLICIVTNR